MKESYHKLIDLFLKDGLQSEEDKQIFKFEAQWKNLCHPPLLPLYTTH